MTGIIGHHDSKEIERIVRDALTLLPWTTSDAVIRIGGDITCRLVADEDHWNDSVVYADTTGALASIEDEVGFLGDRFCAWDDFAGIWDRVAREIGRNLGIELSVEYWDNQQIVLLMI